jgi:hypothetical protein
MKNRHKVHRASGGRTVENPPVKTAYAGGSSNVVKEAMERKHGGRTKKEEKHEKHHVEGHKAKMHLGRPGRKTGGRIGADKAPLSTAARVKSSEHAENPD